MSRDREAAQPEHTLSVGISDQDGFTTTDPRIRRRLLQRVADVGLNHVTMGDHVSFHGGSGFDGMVTASTLLASHDSLPVLIGVYLLGLRHPMLAARQLSTLAQTAPGRLTLGVGVAGEDRAEVANAGVDPGTRGRHLDEALPLVRRLLARFAETRERILEAVADRGRPAPSWFGVSVWCGLDGDAGQARNLVAAKLERLYRLPSEKFQALAPAGTPKQVAEFLYPYVESGARHVTLIPAGRSIEAEIDAAAEVSELLRAAAGRL